jgi:hypothetical protein
MNSRRFKLGDKDKPYGSLRKISVNYLSIPFSEHFEQPATIAQRVDGVLLVRRFDGIFKPEGYAWVCKDLFEGHISVLIRHQLNRLRMQIADAFKAAFNGWLGSSETFVHESYRSSSPLVIRRIVMKVLPEALLGMLGLAAMAVSLCRSPNCVLPRAVRGPVKPW